MTSSTDHYEEKFWCAAYYEVIALVQTLPSPNHYQHSDTALLLQLVFDLASVALFSSTPKREILSRSYLRRARLIRNWLELHTQTCNPNDN